MHQINTIHTKKLNKFQAKHVPTIGVLRVINLWQNHRGSLGENAEIMGVWDSLKFIGFPDYAIKAKLVRLYNKGYITPLTSWRHCLLTDEGLDKLQEMEMEAG